MWDFGGAFLHLRISQIPVFHSLLWAKSTVPLKLVSTRTNYSVGLVS